MTVDSIKHEISQMFPVWSFPSGVGKKKTLSKFFHSTSVKKRKPEYNDFIFLNATVLRTSSIVHL